MLEGGRLQARRSPTLDRNYNASRGHNDSNGRAPPGGPPPLARRRPAPAPAPALPRARLQHVGLMLVILSITVLYYGIHMYTLYVCISLSLYIYIYIYTHHMHTDTCFQWSPFGMHRLCNLTSGRHNLGTNAVASVSAPPRRPGGNGNGIMV